MTKYAVALAAMAGVMLAACGNKEDDAMRHAIAERDTQALVLCQDYARSQANHPSTVDFSTWGTRIKGQPDGSVIVLTKFTAKNAFGLELKFEAVCRVNGHGIVESGVREAQG
ncbi:hypothetical protein QZM78_03350 [Burkholderia multivorans]|nr:hypothetical protein [Burkholderia multivorans]